MATTEQRSGFRLPWSTETRSSTPSSDGIEPAAEQAPDAEDVPTEVPSVAEATPMTDATEISSAAATPWPAGDHAVVATADSERDLDAAPATSPAGRANRDPAPSAPPRKSNALVTGLVRAMRDAAATARQETAARFAEEAKARVTAIQAASADEVATIRTGADGDVVAIREWSKAEMARIREETEQRIADRKRRLEVDLESHAARIEQRIERVHGAVGAFEQRMDAFFEQLFAEEDPARLAGMAEQLPEPPALEIDDLDDDRWTAPAAARSGSAAPPGVAAGPDETLDAEGAAAAEAAAFADIDPGADDDLDGLIDPAASGDRTDDDVARRLAAFTGPPAGGQATTRLSVTGLVSVAAIAGFKRAVARIDGVKGVAVSSGPTGDFIFTISHLPDADVPSAIPSLDGFSATVTGDADGVVIVTASDPDGGR